MDGLVIKKKYSRMIPLSLCVCVFGNGFFFSFYLDFEVDNKVALDVIHI